MSTFSATSVKETPGLEKLFVCSVCRLDFINETEFQLHSEVHAEKVSDIHENSSRDEGSSLCDSFTTHEKSAQFVCEFCKIDFKTEMSLNLHLFYYDCGLKEYKTKQDYFSERFPSHGLHTEKESSDDVSFLCSVCQKEFPLKILSNHNLNKEKASVCDACQREFSKQYESMQDNSSEMIPSDVLQTVNELSDKISFVCSVCKKDFTHKMKNNHNLMNEKPFLCDVCQNDFSPKIIVGKLADDHSKEGKLSCEICKKLFSDKYVLRKHSRVHTGEKPYVCNYCNEGFVQKCELKKHLRVVHAVEQPFICRICNEPFPDKESMVQHASNVHINTEIPVKRHVCSVCMKAFARKADHANHCRIHTGEKPFACNVCKKAFSENCSLLKHLRIHTGEKPHICDICQKAFSRKGHLTDHYCTHTGEKPFVCDICSKAFTLRKSLQRHYKGHTNEKPYMCNKCDKTFTRKESLDAHLEIHMKREIRDLQLP